MTRIFFPSLNMHKNVQYVIMLICYTNTSVNVYLENDWGNDRDGKSKASCWSLRKGMNQLVIVCDLGCNFTGPF